MKSFLFFLIILSTLLNISLAQDLVINEFIAKNDNVIQDETGNYGDWIEIYNTGSTAVDIGGMYLTDILLNPTKCQIPTTAPDSTTIEPGAFLVIWADEASANGVLHVDFKLGAGGEQIGLFASDGVTVIDTLTFGPQGTNVSYGRMPDGSVHWQEFGEHPEMGYTASPGRSNVTLRINEFLAKNDNVLQDEDGNFGDWLELYNFGQTDVDVTGFHMTDDFANPTLYSFNPAVVPAGGYLLVWFDGTVNDPITDPDTLHAGFKLSAGGDMLGLYLNEFTVIDSLVFGPQTSNISFGRYPDGTENWQTFSLPTPRVSNQIGGGPNISGVVREPLFPEYTEEVIITAEISSINNLTSVELNYDPGINSFTIVSMLDDGLHNDGAAGDGVFGVTIPAQPRGTNVRWYITANDDKPSISVYPAAAPGQPATYLVTEWTPLFVKDLAVREPSGIAYNAITGNLYTHNDENNANIFVISKTGEVLDSLMVGGNDFEGITFNATYDTMLLVEESNFKVVKYLLDGTKVGEIDVAHNPGLTDGLEGIVIDPADGHIFILQEKNPCQLIELSPAGVELNRVTLNFSDDVSDITIHPTWKTLFIVSDQGFSLNEVTKAGKHLRSWQVPLDQVEGVTFGATDTIIYMVSDRGGKFYEFAFEQEQYVAGPALFVNEFLSKNDNGLMDEHGNRGDWLEIYNGDNVPVDVAGMYFTNSLSQPTMWQIPDSAPDSTTIQPGGFLLLWCDADPQAGILHTNFKLSAGGAQVGIYWDSNSQISVVDSVTFGPQLPDISYGRLEDAGNEWVTFSTTSPGETNANGVATAIKDTKEKTLNEFVLHQSYPNPFNPLTTIKFHLPSAQEVNISVYNLLGQKIATLADGFQNSGTSQVVWDAAGFAGGVYFYTIKTESYQQTKKMILIK